MLPLISQIILDAYLFPDMLYKPRMLLIGFDGTGNVKEEEGAPHMRLIRDLMTDGTITLDKVRLCLRLYISFDLFLSNLSDVNNRRLVCAFVE